MKKLLGVVIGILAVCVGLLVVNYRLSPNSEHGDRELDIYNWGDYVDPALITKFEKQTGYKVRYETFDSNEAMLTKIKQGGTSYDLTVPSEYTVEKMRQYNLIQSLDKSRLTGLENLDPTLLNLDFDHGNRYSLPYFWGTLGIVYNDQMVAAKDVQHWEQLWNPQLRDKLMLVDSARDIMGMALITQGNSVNSANYAQLEAAKNHLDSLMPNVKAIVDDEIKMYMAQNEAAVAVTYSGEAAEMMAHNSHLHYIIPSEGSNLWVDSWVIPRSARHKTAAYAFLNFMMQPANAAQNAEYVGYSTPNSAAKALLPKKIRNDQEFYPPRSITKHLQVYRNLDQRLVGEYNDLFLEFKMTRK